MLDILNDLGEDSGSRYNDGEAVNGWFGWSVHDNLLTVGFTDADRDESRTWKLILLEDE